MKSFSFSLITLPALALGALSLANAKSSSEFRKFARDLGLPRADIDTFVALCTPGDSTDKYARDQSCKTLKWLFPDDTYLPSAANAYQAKTSINWWVNTSLHMTISQY